MNLPTYPQRPGRRPPAEGADRYRVNGSTVAPTPRDPATRPADTPGTGAVTQPVDAGEAIPDPHHVGPARQDPSGRARSAVPRRAASPHGDATGERRSGPGVVSRLRMSLGLKLGVVVGTVMAVAAMAALVLINETRVTVDSYNVLLAKESRQAQLALQMQVAFKQQVQEWKDVLLRGDDPNDLAKYAKQFQDADARVDALYEELLRTIDDPDLKGQVEQYHSLELGTDAGYARALQIMKDSRGQDYRQADQLVRGIDRAPTAALGQIVDGRQAVAAERAAQVETAAAERQRMTLLVTVVLFVVMACLLAVVLIRLVRPVRALTRQALLTATERLPAAIERVKVIRSDDEAPSLPPFHLRTGDELEELGEALTTLQESAIGQAVGQRRAERETAEMLVNLGRRNQNLLGRMLGYVTELERREQDPEVLSQLFRLDHATTRIRRNAESMLVLAGATQTRIWSRPVPVVDAVRAALSEIEDYVRVDLHHVEEGSVSGSAVADVVHLLAELMENATHFSPPTTQVTVIGQAVREGYRLRVIDQGVGMTRRELDQANQRIRRADVGWADSKLLGLYVVGRLAQRRGIGVALEASAGRGITASVLLPTSILAGRQATEQPGRPGAPARPGPEPAAADAQPAGAGIPARPAGDGDRFIDLTAAAGAGGGDADGARDVADLPTQAGARRSPYATPTSPGGIGLDGGTGSGEPEPVPLPGNPYALPPAPTFPPPLQGAATAAAGRAPAVPMSPAPVPSPAPVGTTPAPASASHQGSGAVLGAPVAVPRRVRGAQLPDLGPAEDPVVARPDEGPGAPESLRWQLRSFQLDVQAARRAIAESGDHLDSDHRPEGQG